MPRLTTTWSNLGRMLLSAAITLVLGLALHSPAQDLAKRLILKDGSYQLVTRYEVKGDRVRYKSAERDEWEELPAAMVDWSATEKYEKDRATSPIPEAAALDKEADNLREAERTHLPEVAPGLRLPEDSGVFLLDNYQGEPQLVEMQQPRATSTATSKPTFFADPSLPSATARTNPWNSRANTPRCTRMLACRPSTSKWTRMSTEPPPGEPRRLRCRHPSLDAPRAEQQGPQQPPRRPATCPTAAATPAGRAAV